MTQRLSYAVCLAALGVLVFGAYVYTPQDECLSEELPVSCFMQKTYRIGVNQGIPEALMYAREIIEPYSRNALHMSMHMAGHAAYDTFRNRSEAMEFLPPEAWQAGEQLIYDGYQHGVLQAYFLDAGMNTPVETLMRESCDAWYEAQKNEVRGEWGRAGLGCFHGIGHALMALYDNNVHKSTLICATLPSEWSREWCAYGVFMEASYQYHPSYGHSLVREGDDMREICATAPALTHICAKFIGHSFLMKQPHNYAGAFSTCNKLSIDDAQSCRVYMAEVIFPGLSSNPNTLATWCEASGDFAEECFYWAASGLTEGFGGSETMHTNICSSLAEEKKGACTAFVEKYQASLSMHDAR